MLMVGIINIVVLTLTFFAILWYSYETRLLRIETLKLRKIQSQPYVTFFMEDVWDKDKNEVGQHFYIKNTGQGLAKNISIKPYDFEYKYGLDKKVNKVFKIKSFDFISSLSSKETTEIFAQKDDNDDVGDKRSKKVDPKYIRIPGGKNHKVKIIFYDFQGSEYFAEQEVCPNFHKVINDSFSRTIQE